MSHIIRRADSQQQQNCCLPTHSGTEEEREGWRPFHRCLIPTLPIPRRDSENNKTNARRRSRSPLATTGLPLKRALTISDTVHPADVDIGFRCHATVPIHPRRTARCCQTTKPTRPARVDIRGRSSCRTSLRLEIRFRKSCSAGCFPFLP
jgi:hypothetical protein